MAEKPGKRGTVYYAADGRDCRLLRRRALALFLWLVAFVLFMMCYQMWFGRA